MLNMIAAATLALILASPAAAQNPPAAPAPATPVKATPQNAAAFVGDWDLTGEGSNGPASFTLSLKAQDQVLTALVANGEGIPQTVTDVSMVGADLAVSVSFINAGTEYPSVISLTPSDGKVLMHIEVANGLAQLDGLAKKKTPK